MTERMSCVGKEHKYLKNSSLRQIQIVIVAVVALVVVVNVSPILPIPPSCHYLVYVTDAGQLATPDNRVSVIDTATNTIVATIPVGTAPLEVAITPNGAFGYVPAFFSDNVTVLALPQTCQSLPFPWVLTLLVLPFRQMERLLMYPITDQTLYRSLIQPPIPYQPLFQ